MYEIMSPKYESNRPQIIRCLILLSGCLLSLNL
jgi:hypothetical protein